MLQIDDTLISFDVLEQKFLCDLQSCKGICCIEGDAGAPLEPEEVKILEDLLPVVWDDLSEKSREIIKRQGVSYIYLHRGWRRMRIHLHGRRRHLQMCHRKGLPRGQNRFLQTHFMPPVSYPAAKIQQIHRGELPPMVGMRMCTPMRYKSRNAGLQIPERAADTPFRAGLVRPTGNCRRRNRQNAGGKT